jgi:transcriptional regulator with XRE-family HTH domain
MKKSRPSLSVRLSLRQLGEEIRQARLRRRLRMQVLAERAMICRVTLDKIQKGDPSVAMGSYAAVIFGLGFKTPFNKLITYETDPARFFFEEEVLRKRARLPRDENSTPRARKPKLVCVAGTKGGKKGQDQANIEDNDPK